MVFSNFDKKRFTYSEIIGYYAVSKKITTSRDDVYEQYQTDLALLFIHANQNNILQAYRQALSDSR